MFFCDVFHDDDLWAIEYSGDGGGGSESSGDYHGGAGILIYTLSVFWEESLTLGIHTSAEEAPLTAVGVAREDVVVAERGVRGHIFGTVRQH